MKSDVRRRGALKILGGVVAYVGVWLLLFRQGGFGEGRGGTFYIITMAAPGGLALIGLVELYTGKSFNDLAARWDALPGWKQAVIAMATVLGAIVLIFGPLLLIGWLTYDG